MAEARRLVGDVPNVTLHDIPTNDAWMRDHGPTVSGRTAGRRAGAGRLGLQRLGRKVSAVRSRQPRAAAQLPRSLGATPIRARHRAGRRRRRCQRQGTLLTTEQCLLSRIATRSSRRATDRATIWPTICACRHVIWLGEGIVGDDTDGHIDELARFVGPRTVVAAVEEDPADENYRAAARQPASRLQRRPTKTAAAGVVALPMPRPMFFNDAAAAGQLREFLHRQRRGDRAAIRRPGRRRGLEILARLFPDRRDQRPCRPWIWPGDWARSTASRSSRPEPISPAPSRFQELLRRLAHHGGVGLDARPAFESDHGLVDDHAQAVDGRTAAVAGLAQKVWCRAG